MALSTRVLAVVVSSMMLLSARTGCCEKPGSLRAALEYHLGHSDLVRLSTDKDGPPSFQCELRMYSRPVLGATRHFRLVFERKDETTALAIFTDHGLPIAIIENNQLIAIDRAKPNTLVGVGRVAFEFSVGASGFGNLGFTNSQVPSTLSIDIPSICRKLLDASDSIREVREQHALYFDIQHGSTAQIHLKRDNWPYGPPIASVRVNHVERGGWLLHSIMFGAGIDRSVIGLGERLVRDGDWEIRDAGDEKQDAMTSFLSIMRDWPRLSRELHEWDAEPFQQSAKRLEELLSAPSRLPEEHIKEISDCLDTLSKNEDGNQDDNVQKKRAKAIFKLMSLLRNNILWPMVMFKDRAMNKEGIRKSVGTFMISGCDLERVGNRVERALGAQLANRLYRSLAGIAMDPSESTNLRSFAIDALGLCGLPTDSGLLEDIATSMNKEPKRRLKLSLSLARIFTRRGTSEDLRFVREVLGDMDLSATDRYACLEALLRADATLELEPTIESILGTDILDPSTPVSHLQCCLAAACSVEGRAWLLKVLQSDHDSGSPIAALLLLDGQMGPHRPSWEEYQEAVEAVVFDPTANNTFRLAAIRTASSFDSNRPFRDTFIRWVLAEGDDRAVVLAMQDYLYREESIELYADALEERFTSSNLRMQKFIAVFLLRVAAETDSNKISPFASLVEKMADHNDSEIQKVAELLTRHAMK